jgi:hypothetical protein
MSVAIYLFCGGPAIYAEGRPKPLMKIREDRSLLAHYLIYLKHHRKNPPKSVTLLCDDAQEAAIKEELSNLSYPVPIYTIACGHQPSTFEKLCRALNESAEQKRLVQFGYPDIFSFDEFTEPNKETLDSSDLVHISAAILTSRFPRLIVDVYNNKVLGISNYTSPVPANPMHVFGGDLWGRGDHLLELVKEFKDHSTTPFPSLEYDFFFWLINNNKINCVLIQGERMWVDSSRDFNKLLQRTGHFS